MNWAILKSKSSLTEILLLIIAFTLPFYQQASIIAIVGLVVAWLFDKRFIGTLSNLKENPLLILWITFYVLHLSGLLWSDNLSYGFKDLETKLSFLIFPLVIGNYIIAAPVVEKIKQAFIIGTLVAVVYCVGHAIISYQLTSNVSVFFYTDLSALMHTSYFTMYINLALLFLLENCIERWHSNSKAMQLLQVTGLFLLASIIILLSARTAIVVSAITIIFYSLTQIVKYKKGAAYLIISLIIVSLIHTTAIKIFNRYQQLSEPIKHTDEKMLQQQETTTYNSTQSHIEIWKNALIVIEQNLFIGVGTGDIKEELNKQYSKVGFQFGIDHLYNPHNQYLHTGVILGVVGCTLLICSLLIPLYFAIQYQNWLYVCFLIIILLNAMTESILERQNGILFYAFFNVFFYLQIIKIRMLMKPAN